MWEDYFLYIKTCKKEWRTYFLYPLLSRWFYFFILPVTFLTRFWCLSVKQQIRNRQLHQVFKGKHTKEYADYVHKSTEFWPSLVQSYCKAEKYRLSKMCARDVVEFRFCFQSCNITLNFKAKKKKLSTIYIQQSRYHTSILYCFSFWGPLRNMAVLLDLRHGKERKLGQVIHDNHRRAMSACTETSKRHGTNWDVSREGTGSTRAALPCCKRRLQEKSWSAAQRSRKAINHSREHWRAESRLCIHAH